MGLTMGVTGPTGEIGISAVTALERDPAVDRIVGMARRPFDPALHGWTKTTYHQGDIMDRDAVDALVADADVVIHLAFIVLGSRAESERVNLAGTRIDFEAAVAANGSRGWSTRLRPRLTATTPTTRIRSPKTFRPADRPSTTIPGKRRPANRARRNHRWLFAGSVRASSVHRRRTEGDGAGRRDAVESVSVRISVDHARDTRSEDALPRPRCPASARPS